MLLVLPLAHPILYKGPGGGMVGMGRRDETVGMEPQGDRERGDTLVHKDRLEHKVCNVGSREHLVFILASVGACIPKILNVLLIHVPGPAAVISGYRYNLLQGRGIKSQLLHACQLMRFHSLHKSCGFSVLSNRKHHPPPPPPRSRSPWSR